MAQLKHQRGGSASGGEPRVLPPGLIGRLFRWTPRGDGTRYRVDPDTCEFGFGAWWRLIDRPGSVRLVVGLDPLTLVVVLVVAAGVGAFWWLMPFPGVVRVVGSAVAALFLGFFVLHLVATPRILSKHGPPLEIDHAEGVAQLPSGRRIPLKQIDAVEWVAFAITSPRRPKPYRGETSYTWGSHLVLRLSGSQPEYVAVATIGSNLKAAGRRLAARLNVPFRWTHLGLLERVWTDGELVMARLSSPLPSDRADVALPDVPVARDDEPGFNPGVGGVPRYSRGSDAYRSQSAKDRS